VIDLPKPPVDGPKPDDKTKPPVDGPKPDDKAKPPPVPSDEQKVPAGWKKLQSDKGRYSILLPEDGQEEKLVQDLPTGDGQTTKLFLHGCQRGKSLFAATYADYSQAPAPEKVQAVIDAVIGGNARGQKGTVTGSQEIKLLGLPGKEAEIKKGNGAVVKLRVFLDGNRLYQIMVGGPPNDVPEKDVKTFLDSFKVTGK
jgi:hypothetical protein